jgi:hypothetical protein
VTFCVGIRVREGLVALADTQIVRGQEFSNKAKLSLLEHAGSAIFLMTSGLRSIRDKAVLRLEDELAALPALTRGSTAWSPTSETRSNGCVTRTGRPLDHSGLRFDSHALDNAPHSRHLACDAGLASDRGVEAWLNNAAARPSRRSANAGVALSSRRPSATPFPWTRPHTAIRSSVPRARRAVIV